MSGEIQKPEDVVALDKKSAVALRARLATLRTQIEKGYTEFAKELWTAINGAVNGEPMYQVWGYATFDDYSETELGMKRGKAYYLAQIWGELHVKAHIPEQKIAQIEWCMPPETQIATPRGYVNLGDIEIGDSLFAASGNVTKVVATEKSHADHLYEITCDYVGCIKATEHHWFPVIKDGARLFRQLSRKGRLSKGELPAYSIERVKADAIEAGDLLIVNRPISDRRDSDFTNNSDEFFEFAGWFVAEGYVDRNRLVIKLGASGESELDDIIVLAERVFPQCSVSKYECAGNEYGPVWQMTVSQDSTVARQFETWFGSGARNKKLPETIFSLSDHQIKAFLRGLWLGDGSISRTGVHIVDTTSYVLATQVRLLLNRLGILGTICVTRRSEPQTDLWTVAIGRFDGHEILGDLCPSKSSGYHWYKSIPEGMAVIIRSTERKPYDGPVIHLGTEEGTFCCPVNSYNSKAKQLAPLAKAGGITAKNVDEWVKKAKIQPVHQFAQEVKSAKAAHVSGTSNPPETVYRITVGLYEEQHKNYQAALKAAAVLAESTKTGHLWDMICLEFNAQYAGKVGGDRMTAIKRYVAMMERAFGVRTIVIDADNDKVLAGKDMIKELMKDD